MKKGLIVSESLLFVAVALLLWFRDVDGNDATNDLNNKLATLGVWIISGIIIAGGQFILFKLTSKKRENIR